MINVSYIALAGDCSSFYRCQGVFPFIISKKINFHDISDKPLHSWTNYLKADILVFQRPFSDDHIGVIYVAQTLGIRVILDYDDDVLNIPEHNPAYKLYNDHKENVKQCLRMADEIWVSTQAIADSFAQYNKNIHVIPNAHNNHLWPESKKAPFNYENKTVMYRGGATHYLDLFEYTEWLVRVAHENPSWSFTYMGQMGNEQFFRANKGNFNVNVTNSVPFIQYLDHIRKVNPMVAICPLEDSLLNRGKSNCFWLEMTYAGAAVFGDKNLPEFDLEGILPLSALDSTLKADLVTRLRKHHEDSWVYIKDNLFLSEVNKVRIERLLA